MASIRIQIDGRWVDAQPDETILQVARRNRIEIPTLCHDDQLEPYTSCFLCVVEVEGARTLQPACATKVREGMVVRTRSDVIESSRKMALELLLSNHFADCLGPCKINCPAGVDVQGYVALAAMGKYREAIRLIKEKNPLPTVCGRVCTRPCELNCRRNIVDEGVAVDDIKRFIADKDLFSEDRYFPDIKRKRKEKVAIIGAGPAGLSAAYYLSIEGYQVDIYEGKPKPGGMLRYGIPQYRLPEEILDKEIEGITRLGVTIHANQKLGQDFTLDDLFKKGYKAVFLALGAQKSTQTETEGNDLENVLAGIEFLAQVKSGDIRHMRGTVAVVGGGNTAVDAARTALRLGAKKVMMIYRRTIKEMPANPEEIEAARHEGIEILFLTNPKRYIGENGRLKEVECIRMELGEPDASGRRRPVPVEGSEFRIPVDYVIEAIGQKPDLYGLPISENGGTKGFKLTRWGTFATDPVTMMTNIPGVFAAGDVVLGPATAIEAIAGGRKAANGIHHFITGKWIEEIKPPFISRRDVFRKLTPQDYLNVESKPRHKRPELDPKERILTFDEVEKTFREEDVLDEAIRCLECGCKAFFECDLQKYATEYQADQKAFLGEFQEYEIDRRHPFIEFDLNKCILCGRCMRICDEVVGASALGLVNRGFITKIAPSLERPLQNTSCITCGLCVDSCPTGAISDEFYTVKPGPWKTETRTIVCTYCSVGCDRKAHVVGEQITRITADEHSRVNPFGNLCFKGRYGFEYLYLGKRILHPHIRKNGKWERTSLEEAIAHVTAKMKDSGWQHEVYVAPRLALEDFYQIQKFARVVLETNNIRSLGNSLQPYFPAVPMFLNTGLIREISLSDQILVLNADLMKNYPVVHYEVIKAVRDKKTVYGIGSEKNSLSRKAPWMTIQPDGFLPLLQLLVHELIQQEQYNKLCDDRHPGFIRFIKETTGQMKRDELLEKSGMGESELNTILSFFKPGQDTFLIMDLSACNDDEKRWVFYLQALIKGTTVKSLALTRALNVPGQWLMGIHPELAPGGREWDQAKDELSTLWAKNPFDPEGGDAALLAGKGNKNKIVWIFGEDPLGDPRPGSEVEKAWNQFPMKIVFDSIWTRTAEEADVVFPMMPLEECGGLFINAEGRILEGNKATTSRTTYSMIGILADIAREMGYYLMGESLEAVRGDMARVIPWIDEVYSRLDRDELVFVQDYTRYLAHRLIRPDRMPQRNGFPAGDAADGVLNWIRQYALEKGLTL